MNEKTSTDSALVGEFIGELDVPDVVGVVDALGLRLAWLILEDNGDIVCSLVSPVSALGLCIVSVKLIADHTIELIDNGMVFRDFCNSGRSVA